MEAKKFYAVFGIYDANTMIELNEFNVQKVNSSEYRAKRAAISTAMSYTHDRTLGIIQKRYDLTAKQLGAMITDHFISPTANYFVVTLKYFGDRVPKGKCRNKGIRVDDI